MRVKVAKEIAPARCRVHTYLRTYVRTYLGDYRELAGTPHAFAHTICHAPASAPRADPGNRGRGMTHLTEARVKFAEDLARYIRAPEDVNLAEKRDDRIPIALSSDPPRLRFGGLLRARLGGLEARSFASPLPRHSGPSHSRE